MITKFTRQLSQADPRPSAVTHCAFGNTEGVKETVLDASVQRMQPDMSEEVPAPRDPQAAEHL